MEHKLLFFSFIEAGKTSERVAVFFSRPGLEKAKLLGIPAVIDLKGETQSIAVVKLLKEWKVFEVITAFVFDTTASNTRHHKGAAILIEKLYCG